MSARRTHHRKAPVSRSRDRAVPFCLVPLREAAAIIGISPRTPAHLVTLERVPGYRFAGMKKLLFKPEELLTLLQPTVSQRRAQ